MAVLPASDTGISDLVKLTIYLVGDADTTKRREVLSTWLKDHKLCMTLLHVAALANPKIKVELDALACKK